MTSRFRVLNVINNENPDRGVTDFQAVPEVREKMKKKLNVSTDDEVLEALEIDCRWIYPEYIGPQAVVRKDGSYKGWGGSWFTKVRNEFGEYEEVIEYALDGVESVEEIDARLELPHLDNYDYSVISELCKKYDQYAIFTGYCSAFYFPTQVRNMEDILLDMALRPELVHHLIKRCADWHLDFHARILEAGKGRIDVLQSADDYATQTGPMFSLEMFREFFKKPMSEFVQLGKAYNAYNFHHCCGSAYQFIPEFIEAGFDILDPVQTTAANMEPKKLSREFGQSISFHGAMNTQGTLPKGTPEQVKEEAKELYDIFGKNRYFLTACHLFQADVPVENILAMYELEK